MAAAEEEDRSARLADCHDNSTMDTDDTDDLKALVRSLDRDTLAKVLLELAADHEPVRERLQRLRLAAQPRKLAAAFRATLSGWRRGTRFINYRDSRAFARQIEAWLEQVGRELAPADPPLALELVETLIRSDEALFERADDSDGCIGDALRTACRLWLQTAARCEPPPGGWGERVYRLASDDGYGVREALLRHANLLLDEPGLRALVARFEGELAKSLESGSNRRGLPTGVFGASGSLHLLSDALRDPDVHVKAVLSYSPTPNPLQKEAFVAAYLKCGRHADALRWLDGNWEHHERARLRLLAEAYAGLGRREECAQIRKRLFDATASVYDFREWRDVLREQERDAAGEHARQAAEALANPIAAATLLLELGDTGAAEALLVRRHAAIDGRDYPRLVPLAEALEKSQHRLGATACYRALLLAILDRAYARAYGHAASYLGKLRQLAAELGPQHDLESHGAFEAALRAKHPRKTAFWSRVTAG